MAQNAVVVEEGNVVEDFGGECFYLISKRYWLECVSGLQESLEGWGELVLSGCLS